MNVARQSGPVLLQCLEQIKLHFEAHVSGERHSGQVALMSTSSTGATSPWRIQVRQELLSLAESAPGIDSRTTTATPARPASGSSETSIASISQTKVNAASERNVPSGKA